VSWTTYVGSGAVVAHDDRVLMIKQRRPYGTHWELPGGYCESPESLEAAARREVLEETNVEVEVGELVATLVWERAADARRNVLAWFAATPTSNPDPRPQIEEEIDEACFVDPGALAAEIHPLEKVVLDRWWPRRETGFHIRATIGVRPDGTQEYLFDP
jgi:8-oxo-dGTP pyrophosphatase MutT (NUDIX family)